MPLGKRPLHISGWLATAFGPSRPGAKVDFGAGLKFDFGSTWTFADPQEADAMRKQLEYLVEQEIMKHDPYYAIMSLWSDAEGKLGLTLPWDADPNAKSSIPNLRLADAGLKFGGSGKWTQIHDTETGLTTYTHRG